MNFTYCYTSSYESLRLRSGRVPLNTFYHMVGVKSSPLCDNCNRPEDVIHVLMECVQYRRPRSMLLPNIRLFNGGVNVLLKQPVSEECKVLYGFMKICLKERSERTGNYV